MLVDLLEVFIAWTGRENVLMAKDSCYSAMLCFTDYIKFLSHDVGGEGVGHCYILSKLLYNIIWGRRCYKLAFTILIRTKLEVEWMGYRAVKKAWQMTIGLCSAVLIQYQRVTDRQTDVQPIAKTCFSIADARKNCVWFHIFVEFVVDVPRIAQIRPIEKAHWIKFTYCYFSPWRQYFITSCQVVRGWFS